MARRSACKYIANSIDYYILSFPQRLWGNLLFDEVKGGSSNCDTLIPVVAMYHSKSPDNIKELVFSSLLEVDGKCRVVIATSAQMFVPSYIMPPIKCVRVYPRGRSWWKR